MSLGGTVLWFLGGAIERIGEHFLFFVGRLLVMRVVLQFQPLNFIYFILFMFLSQFKHLLKFPEGKDSQNTPPS